MSEDRRFDWIFSLYSAERTTTTSVDDVAVDSNFISSEPVWDWTIFPSDYDEALRLYADRERVYPNYPHVYNWRKNEFTADHLRDFFDVAERSAYFLDPNIFLIVLYAAYKRSVTTIRADAAISQLLSRAMGIFLTSLLERFVKFGIYNIKLLEILYYYFDRDDFVGLYKYVKLEDFLNNVAIILATRLSNDSEDYDTRDFFDADDADDDDALRAKLLFSKIFFTIVMRITTIHFREITFELRSVMSRLYGNFVSIGNSVMALPFSFFVSISEISKNSEVTFENTFAPVIQETVRRFVKNFRIVYSNSSEYEREPLNFENLAAPDFRRVNAKLNAFLNAYSFVGKLKRNEHAHRDIFLSTKIFGAVPFREIPLLRREFETDEIEKRFSSFPLDGIYVAVRDAFTFFNRIDPDDDRVYSYHPTYEDLRKLINLDDDDETEASVDKERCAVCLSEEYEKTLFLPCFHDVCSSCAVRLDTCPLCREPIIARVSNYAGIYDDLQLCVLYESFSMFRKYFKIFA